MGNPVNCSIDLKFQSLGNNSVNICSELLHFKPIKNASLNFDGILPRSTALVVPRCSKLKINAEHNKPALVGEWYKIALKITNEEAFAVKNLQIEVYSPADEVEFCGDNSLMPVQKLPLAITVDSLPISEQKEISFCVRTFNVGGKHVIVKVLYLLESDQNIASTKEETFLIPVIKPFDVNTKFLSTLLEDIQKCYIGEEFAVMPVLKCLSPWPIVIEQTSVEFVSLFFIKDFYDFTIFL